MMDLRLYTPDDYDCHGILKLPWLFWLVLLWLGKTWLLFIMAGASRQQGGALLALFYPDKVSFWLGLAAGLPALLGGWLSGVRHRYPYVWRYWRWLLLFSALLQCVIQLMALGQDPANSGWIFASAAIDLLAAIYLFMHRRLRDNFSVSN